jgi:hypothetical protein
MEAGETELRKVFEEVTTGNVKAVLDYCQKTRGLLRALEEKVLKLEGLLQSQNAVIDALRLQLAGVQTIVFSKGT